MVELENVKSTVEILKKEVAFERKARIDTDRELTALTERYRNLLIEHEDTKRTEPIDIVNYTSQIDAVLSGVQDTISALNQTLLNTISDTARSMKESLTKEMTKHKIETEESVIDIHEAILTLNSEMSNVTAEVELLGRELADLWPDQPPKYKGLSMIY